jgi:carbamate kinase
MRILIALMGEAPPQREEEMEGLAEIAAEHGAVIVYDREEAVGCSLELTLRNALPDRDLVTILSRVVVSADDAAFIAPSGVPSPNPSAIADLRGIRALLDAGFLVICAVGRASPILVDPDGKMCEVEAAIDVGRSAALLARRLDVDLLLVLSDDAAGSGEEAARRFVEATERRAAIGAATDAVQIVRGAAGTQIAPRPA